MKSENLTNSAEKAPKVAVSFKVSPASKVKIAGFAERNGQSVSEFCEMHVLDACHRMAGEGESLEAGTFAEEIQGIFKQAFIEFRENVLELLEEREAFKEEPDEAEFLELLGLPEKLEEKLNAFLEEAVAHSAAEDKEPLDEADILHRLLAYACKHLASKPAFFGKPYVGEVEII